MAIQPSNPGPAETLRCRLCSSSGAPTAPAPSARFISTYPGSNRRMNPTCTSRRPAATSAATTSRHSPESGESGFSQSTGLPAATAASVSPACVASGLATSTASTSPRPIAASPSLPASAPQPSATARARAPSASTTTCTRAPGTSSARMRA